LESILIPQGIIPPNLTQKPLGASYTDLVLITCQMLTSVQNRLPRVCVCNAISTT